MRRRRSSKVDSNEALARLCREPLFSDPFVAQAPDISPPVTPPEAEHGVTANNPTSLRLHLTTFVATLFENAGTVLIIRIVGTLSGAHTSGETGSSDSQSFIPTTAVFLGELFKLIVCSVLVVMGIGDDFKAPISNHDYYLIDDRGQSTAARVERGFSVLTRSFQPAEMVSSALPATMYVVRDQLVYYSLVNCTAGLFMSTYHLKVAFGGFLGTLVLGRTLPWGKQVAMLLLCFGISLVHYAAYMQRNNDNETVFEHTWQHRQSGGIAAAVAAALCSSVGGTYSEALLKRKTNAAAESHNGLEKPLSSFWLTNLRLSVWGTVIGFAAVCLQNRHTIWGSPTSQGGGFLGGYTPGIWLLVCAQAASGLVSSACLRYRSDAFSSIS